MQTQVKKRWYTRIDWERQSYQQRGNVGKESPSCEEVNFWAFDQFDGTYTQPTFRKTCDNTVVGRWPAFQDQRSLNMEAAENIVNAHSYRGNKKMEAKNENFPQINKTQHPELNTNPWKAYLIVIRPMKGEKNHSQHNHVSPETIIPGGKSINWQKFHRAYNREARGEKNGRFAFVS